MRWAGRHGAKDQLRQAIWRQLEESGAGIPPLWSAIPDFVGANIAAERLAELPFWQRARVIKSNPDRGQAWVRLRALQDGKRVYTPVPELVAEFPFLLLDPERLAGRGVSFEAVMYSDGALAHGERVAFEAMEPMDVCVVGCVAVSETGGRTGKGAGFADLEMGIFRLCGTLPDTTPVVTTVHERQLVDANRIVMEPHDTPLDWIVTPERALQTRTELPRPDDMDWASVRDDQYAAIPFLAALRARLEQS